MCIRDRVSTQSTGKFKRVQKMDISAKVKEIIVEKLGVDPNEVTPEASFTNDLGADSLDTVELIMEFEKEFNVSIPDEQAENIQTVGAVSYTHLTLPTIYSV
eukprot:TRINITY_DN1646_c0_g1_i5.p1 TRINITY_DN1646_c0_g1~~TRINITY_DN1646_c0_g1_i5.p1  ORF type:complete len:102 (+),score=30.67 TRINITY_DN1646_c0_g1_i5:148-453(+)